MNKMKKRFKGVYSLLSAVIAFAMIAGLISGANAHTVRADVDYTSYWKTEDGGSRTICLGTNGIAPPSEGAGGWSYVYYGKCFGSPALYRVLTPRTQAYNALGDSSSYTMLLDSDYRFFTRAFDESNQRSNVWYTDENNMAPINYDINTGTGDKGIFNRQDSYPAFSSTEKSAIAASYKEATSADDVLYNEQRSSYFTGVSLHGEHVFLLDAKEATTPAYGYSDSIGNDANRAKVGVESWWLRSPESENSSRVAYVDISGCLWSHDADNDRTGVSPAFNVSLSSVIFTCLSSDTPGAGRQGAKYKLVIKDEGISVAKNGDVTRSGNTVTIPYTVTCTDGSDANCVSVVMLDKEYTAGNTNGAKVMFYKELGGTFAKGTTVDGTFELPTAYSNTWKTYIVAENVQTTGFTSNQLTDYGRVLETAIVIPGTSGTNPNPDPVPQPHGPSGSVPYIPPYVEPEPEKDGEEQTTDPGQDKDGEEPATDPGQDKDGEEPATDPEQDKDGEDKIGEPEQETFAPEIKGSSKNGGVTLKWNRFEGAEKFRIYQYLKPVTKIVDGKKVVVKKGRYKLAQETDGAKITLKKSLTRTKKKEDFKPGKTYTFAISVLIDGEWTKIDKDSKIKVKILNP